jgi:hypothetical protein
MQLEHIASHFLADLAEVFQELQSNGVFFALERHKEYELELLPLYHGILRSLQ